MPQTRLLALHHDHKQWLGVYGDARYVPASNVADISSTKLIRVPIKACLITGRSLSHILPRDGENRTGSRRTRPRAESQSSHHDGCDVDGGLPRVDGVDSFNLDTVDG